MRHLGSFIVIGSVVTVLSVGCLAQQSKPLFVPSDYGDIRDDIARTPRFWSGTDPQWRARIQPRGDIAGQTTVTVDFAESAQRIPVRFGIPLGQAPSPDHVIVYDNNGDIVPADVFALVNFESSPVHWVMIATVLDSPAAGKQDLTIKWGPEISRPTSESSMQLTLDADGAKVTGGQVEFGLSVADLLHDIRLKGGKHVFAPNGSEVSFAHEDKVYRHQPEGRIQMLFDGPLYKRLRVTSSLIDPKFKLHFEVEVWANSPYLRVCSRLINEHQTRRRSTAQAWFDLNDLRILDFRPTQAGYAISAGDDTKEYTGQQDVALIQRSDTWAVQVDGISRSRSKDDKPIQWTRIAADGEALTFIPSHFQDYCGPDPDLQSQLLVRSDGTMGLRHYQGYPEPDSGAIKFWKTAARTFRMVLHVNSVPDAADYGPGKAAAAIRQWPAVKLDREFLTKQGVFNESEVSTVYDEIALEGARYFDRTRVKRQDYPRAGRGMPPHFEGWIEGMAHPNTDTGGMLFGEVWQYTSAFPSRQMYERVFALAKGPNGNLPKWYTPYDVNGSLTYRCGDHSLALANCYLRTGDRQVYEILQDHSLLYADWAIAHPRGWCHYYPGWTSAGRAYTRLSGPLMSYLVLGDPWLFEVGEQMGGFLVDDWDAKDKTPSGGQSRFVYSARGLCLLYEITGHSSYWNTAADCAIWTMKSSMNATGQVYCYHFEPKQQSRITELFAGYVMAGMCPVYDRCGNPQLFNAIARTGDWLLTRISQPDGHDGTPGEHVGGWCRDQVINDSKDNGPGNCGAMTLCAALETWLADRTGDQKYFYAGAAAWANMAASTNHQGIKGGMPMQMGDREKIGTWSDKFPTYLHHMPSTARKHGWPFVVQGVYDGDPDRDSPIIVFVDKGGSIGHDVYRQPLYATNTEDVTLSVWCPAAPAGAYYDTNPIKMTYDPETQLAQVTLPARCGSGVLSLIFE